MANVISVTVYDFNTVGNKKYATRLMGLPVEGMFVKAVGDTARPDPATYVYSVINYPLAAPASEAQNGYYTAETVAQIITKANA